MLVTARVCASVGSLDTAGEEHLARALKRPRLVWTSQLHARFVEAVNQLGLKSAVPKTIMQVLTTHVHLQPPAMQASLMHASSVIGD